MRLFTKDRLVWPSNPPSMLWLLSILVPFLSGVTGALYEVPGTCHVLTPQPQLVHCQAAAFGAFLPTRGEKLRLCLAGDVDGDMSACFINETDEFSGCVVIVRRGNCTFDQKLAVVASAGAQGMIVVNTDDTLLELSTIEYRASDAFAVSITRSDGDRLIAMATETAIPPNEQVGGVRIESPLSHFDHALLRIGHLISVNAPWVAFETFYAVLPADLKDIDLLLEQVVGSGKFGRVDQVSDIAQFLLKCTTAFLDFSRFANDVIFHAAVGLASLMRTHGADIMPLNQQEDAINTATTQLLGRGYFLHAAKLRKEAFTKRISHNSMRLCLDSFIQFIGGDLVSALDVTRDCTSTKSQFDVSDAGLGVVHLRFLRLIALEVTTSDRHCLKTLSGQTGTSGSNTKEKCCGLSVYNDHGESSHGDESDRMSLQRGTHWFQSKFIEELFHTLTILGVFFDEQGAFTQSLAFYESAGRLCQDWSLTFELRRVLAVPIVFDSTEAMELFNDQFRQNIENLRHSHKAETRVFSSLTGATKNRHFFVHPEESAYLHYTITPPTMFVGYQGHDVQSLQQGIFALRNELFPSLKSRFQTLNEILHRPPTSALRRIAFVSTWFRHHSVGKLILGIVKRLDRSKFHVMIYRAVHFLQSPDELTKEFHRVADSYLELPVNQEDAVALLRHEAIDVLVYPELGMDEWTLLLAHHRVAPVQCVFWGHPITTGNPAIDYFITSEYYTSDFFEDSRQPESTKSNENDESSADWPGRYHGSSFSEQIVLFQGLSTFFARKDLAEREFERPILHLPAAARLYVCPQTLMKLHTHFDEALKGILTQDPLAWVILLSSPSQRYWTEQLRRRFRRQFGEAHRRVVFVPTLPYSDFMGLLSAADVVLDPFPFGGGVTTLDALAVGSPVVTLPSAQTVPQLAAGFLRYMGVRDTIAASVDEYVSLALALARDAARRRSLRARILAQHARLYEDEASVGDWNAFLAAVDVQRQLQPPRPSALAEKDLLSQPKRKLAETE